MLTTEEVKKISEQVKDFEIRPRFNVTELQIYDNRIFKKLQNKRLYEKVADINLSRYESKNFYGGENVWIYKSKRNGHYIYWCYCYGD